MTFFESIGRFFFEKNRAWLFFACSFVPFFLPFAFLLPRYFDAPGNSKRPSMPPPCADAPLWKNALKKKQFFSRYSNSEPYFIDQCLESLPLLQTDLQELQAMKNHPACKNREALLKRIDFLKGPENRLCFCRRKYPLYPNGSKKPMSVCSILSKSMSNDLEHLLSLIEDVPIGRISSQSAFSAADHPGFSADKKNNAIYELNLSLLKREFIHANEK